MDSKNIKTAIIIEATPQFLERGVLWFIENENSIRQAITKQTGVWKNSALLLEIGANIPPQILARKLQNLGYEKTGIIFGHGEYAYRGNIIEIAPINRDGKIIIEFYGNTIETLTEIALEQTNKKILRKTDSYVAGDYIVHLDHGIGIFRGIMQLPDKNGDFFEIEYAAPRHGAKPDTLYVPLAQKKKLSRYIGFETPAIHRLGGTVWITTRKKAREEIENFARELLALYKKRAEILSAPMPEVAELEKQFAESFPHEETPDQTRAIYEVLRDMEKTKPMDRILLGDVGFGKTEVMFRAALRAITNNKQILILTPTTVLAEEHFRTALERFNKLPVIINALTRLTAKSEAQKIIRDFSSGKIDMLIGTHRLLSKDFTQAINERVKLLIIDEEQRFGVKQKEIIKNTRPDIHILSLSATPIPRTFALALAKLRDISTIKTPPPKRLPIQTFVMPYNENFIKKALSRELSRRGQVFFLHNRVETLQLFQKKLKLLAPKAAIECVHGKTPSKIMLRVLRDFRSRKIDILIATTIIENGIDFPNANTLIVEDATRLGLAEAHQLRGRIGRGEVPSYAYFFYRAKNLTDSASMRLNALAEFSYLGAGHDIAEKDLEIRGAGNVLGREQSGVANKVGLNMYFHMLSEIIEKEK